jgi:putative sigma-54 modulation protein
MKKDRDITGGLKMEIKITGTNLEISPRTHRYIEAKFTKLTRHLPDIIDIKVEAAEESTKSPQQRYVVKAAVNSGVGKSVFHGEERAEDLIIAVDRVMEVLTRQLEKHKGKLYERGRGNPQARGRFVEPGPVETERKIVKTKRFIIEPMSSDEAIEEMERLGHDFFLFTDSKADEVRVLYRRKDGNYGLIQPEFKMK